MNVRVRDLILILRFFFPPEMSIQQAIYVLSLLISLFPLYRLHTNQRREPRQPEMTGWMKSFLALLTQAFTEPVSVIEPGVNHAARYAGFIMDDISELYRRLQLEYTEHPLSALHFPEPRPILSTLHMQCKYCPPGDSNIVPTLRRRRKRGMQTVWLLNSGFRWVSATLLVASCPKCGSDYYPDRITRKGHDHRTAELEYGTEYLRVSKQGVWMHRRIGTAQEASVYRFHTGWSSFAEWINDLTKDVNIQFTYRQSQRLFLEHFSRRLLVAHGRSTTFSLDAAHGAAKDLASAVRDIVGVNGGPLPTSMTHSCTECTHLKRYKSELEVEGAPAATQIVGIEEIQIQPDGAVDENPLPEGLSQVLPQQLAPLPGQPRGYVRMAVMDGKSITHRKCAVVACRNPLTNYKNGRFCQDHLPLSNQCGIEGCARAIRAPKTLTCDDVTHIAWHKQYEKRFLRTSFAGVRRVIRRQGEEGMPPGDPTFQVQLQPLGDVPGDAVKHTFKAGKTFCLQTVQWACGVPISWGKCYTSESEPQVLSFINETWEAFPEYRPSFMVYDRACRLLRHIVTQDMQDAWISTTKFVVDAWHYINHQASDPDLVLMQQDNEGHIHRTRAFNTETAEQFNSWLNGFESQLRQMTDVNFDFFVHVLMLLYAENKEKQATELPEDFWDKVNGTEGIDVV
ncbi:hypothetical protein C8F01DRAFT_1153474 [Mycena amicta]|nr:hypothetical protein C8F01DRAFT_1153474 [Mycena amicta]